MAEEKILQYFVSRGFQYLESNKKIFGVEVDLVFFKDHFYFIEVKKLRRWDEIHFRVSQKQMRRLLFARQSYQDLVNKAVELKFAFVGKKDVVVLGVEDLL